MTAEVRERVQRRLDQGQTLSEISRELALSYDVLRKAVGDGRLRKPAISIRPYRFLSVCIMTRRSSRSLSRRLRSSRLSYCCFPCPTPSDSLTRLFFQ